MPTGKPLFLRPSVAGLLVPVAVLGFIVFAIVSSDPQKLVGQCVKVNSAESVTIAC